MNILPTKNMIYIKDQKKGHKNKRKRVKSVIIMNDIQYLNA